MSDRTDATSPSRARWRASVAAARRRRQRSWVIAVALLASFVAGFWAGSSLDDRDLAVGAALEHHGSARAVPEPAPPPVEAPSEVRPTDLVERARDRGEPPPPSGPADFVTPSGNILCAYAGGQLDCHIGSGLAPRPTHRCPQGTGDWAGIRLGPSGPSAPWCSNVRLEERTPPDLELAYGSHWVRDGIACTSHRDGLRCLNDDGGELLLSRAATRHGPPLGEDRSGVGRLGSLGSREHQKVEGP